MNVKSLAVKIFNMWRKWMIKCAADDSSKPKEKKCVNCRAAVWKYKW